MRKTARGGGFQHVDSLLSIPFYTLRKEKKMWDNTLVVFTTDNGGPIYEPGSSNNYPLRGGKYSDFEGGVRTTTFISGGYIPKDRRGTVHKGVVSLPLGPFSATEDQDLRHLRCLNRAMGQE